MKDLLRAHTTFVPLADAEAAYESIAGTPAGFGGPRGFEVVDTVPAPPDDVNALGAHLLALVGDRADRAHLDVYAIPAAPVDDETAATVNGWGFYGWVDDLAS